VGAGWVRNNKSSSCVENRIAGTLLGPETTPGPDEWSVLSPRLVVGCGVW
jgi:hypothetical protein